MAGWVVNGIEMMFCLSNTFLLPSANYSNITVFNKTFLTRTVLPAGSLAIAGIKRTLH